MIQILDNLLGSKFVRRSGRNVKDFRFDRTQIL